MTSKIGICITTYNNEGIIERNLEMALRQVTSYPFELYIVDDGSTDRTPEILTKFSNKYENVKVSLMPHRERGVTRFEAIQMAIDGKCEYLLFVDSDMGLSENLLQECVELILSEKLSAVVVREQPFSEYDNFMSKVKVFERELINNRDACIDTNSIEAARFWRVDEYIRSGGVSPDQIAFEETQPTIRILEKGGVIKRLNSSYLTHDEGYVTLKNILSKKMYYFKHMKTTTEQEDGGLFKALSRWYFFRPYMYAWKNIKLYIQHPIKFLGVLFMYVSLTVVAFYATIKSK